MSFFGFGKKDNNIMTDAAPAPKDFDDGLDDFDGETATPFSTESSSELKNQKKDAPVQDDYMRTVGNFERLNNEQLNDASKTGMKTVKQKSLFGTLKRNAKTIFLNFKDSMSSSADSGGWTLSGSSKTDNEHNYKGLKKEYLYFVIISFFLLVVFGLIFANSNTRHKNQEIKTEENNRPVTMPVNRNPSLTVTDYNSMGNDNFKSKKEEKEDLRKELKGKKVEPSKPLPPKLPELPKQPPQTQVVENNGRKSLRQEAIDSNISFRISNDGAKGGN